MPHSKKVQGLSSLRGRAEARLSAAPPDADPPRTADARLLHELQVHQIELELQNEELRESRRETQAALQQYAALYDFTPVGYFIFDRSGTIRQLNLAGAALLGQPRERLVGQPFRQFADLKDRPAFSAFLSDILTSRRSRHCELTLRGPAGLGPPHFLQMNGMADESGHLVSAVAIDLSEKKRIIEDLRRSNEALERSNLDLQQFAFIAAHDLQTPLRSITSFAQLLQQEYQGRLDAQAEVWLSRLVASAKHLHGLIRDLLAYARVDSRGSAFQPIDFTQLFDDVVATLEAPIRESGALVTRDELPVVVGDRTQLAQVLQNLIDNALKYHGSAPSPPPRIHVSAHRESGEWVFSVRDNGIGIAAKHLERIFEIFQRLHTQQEYPGTGIGLAVCRRVIHRHGGRIWATSEPGQGSLFCFTLPDAQLSPAPK